MLLVVVLVYGLKNEEYYIWSALNDSKIGGEVTGAKWPVTLFSVPEGTLTDWSNLK